MREIGQVAVLSGPTAADVAISEQQDRVALRDVSKEKTFPLERDRIFLDPAEANSSDPSARACARAMLNGPSNVQENRTPEQERSGKMPHPALRAQIDLPPVAPPRGIRRRPRRPAGDRPGRRLGPRDRPRTGRSSIALVWVTRDGG